MTPEEIRAVRKGKGMTQQQFAVEIGVNVTTVARWESGKYSPQPFLVNKLVQMKEELNNAG